MSKSVFVFFCDCEYQKLKISFLSLDLFSLTFKNIFLALLRGDRPAAPYRSATGNRVSVVSAYLLVRGRGYVRTPVSRPGADRIVVHSARRQRGVNDMRAMTRPVRAMRPRHVPISPARYLYFRRGWAEWGGRERAAVINTTPGRGACNGPTR